MTSETLLPPPDAIKTKASPSFYNISGCNKTTLLSFIAFSLHTSKSLTGLLWNRSSLSITWGEEYSHLFSPSCNRWDNKQLIFFPMIMAYLLNPVPTVYQNSKTTPFPGNTSKILMFSGQLLAVVCCNSSCWPDLISSASLHQDLGDVDAHLDASCWDKCRVRRAVRTVAALRFLSRQWRKPVRINTLKPHHIQDYG